MNTLFCNEEIQGLLRGAAAGPGQLPGPLARQNKKEKTVALPAPVHIDYRFRQSMDAVHNFRTRAFFRLHDGKATLAL